MDAKFRASPQHGVGPCGLRTWATEKGPKTTAADAAAEGFSSGGGFGDDVDVLAVPLRGEMHAAVDQRKKRIVLAHAYAIAGVELGAPLANQDVACHDGLAAKALDAQALGVGIPTVAGRAAALLGGEKLEIEREHDAPKYTWRRPRAQRPEPEG